MTTTNQKQSHKTPVFIQHYKLDGNKNMLHLIAGASDLEDDGENKCVDGQRERVGTTSVLQTERTGRHNISTSDRENG